VCLIWRRRGREKEEEEGEEEGLNFNPQTQIVKELYAHLQLRNGVSK